MLRWLVNTVGFSLRNYVDQRELQRRYDRIHQHLDVTATRIQLSTIENVGFHELLERLDDLNVIVGADALLPADAAQILPRWGLTLVIPRRQPLIWLNLLKHTDATALIDTVAHEAIHATVNMLGRHRQTPQPTDELAHHAEEIVALSGATWILNRIGVYAGHQIAQNLATIDQHTAILIALGCNRAFLQQKNAEGVAAAKFLMDLHLIEVAAPTLAELNARR